MATLDERRQMVLLMLGFDDRPKTLRLSISSARKFVQFCEIALRHDLMKGELHTQLYEVVKAISLAASKVVKHQITGARTIRRERALQANKTLIDVPLTVRQHWLIVVACKLAVENPIVGETQRAIIAQFEQQLIAGLEPDAQIGASEIADDGKGVES